LRAWAEAARAGAGGGRASSRGARPRARGGRRTGAPGARRAERHRPRPQSARKALAPPPPPAVDDGARAARTACPEKQKANTDVAVGTPAHVTVGMCAALGNPVTAAVEPTSAMSASDCGPGAGAVARRAAAWRSGVGVAMRSGSARGRRRADGAPPRWSNQSGALVRPAGRCRRATAPPGPAAGRQGARTANMPMTDRYDSTLRSRISTEGSRMPAATTIMAWGLGVSGFGFEVRV
jgi:hypothetical protein